MKDFICTCLLANFKHRVAENKRKAHEKELAEWKRTNAAKVTTLNSVPVSFELKSQNSRHRLTDLVASMAVDDSQVNTHRVLFPRLSDGRIELADYVMALALTDDGSIPTNQPSPLFTSPMQFQESRASHIPTGFDPNRVTVADARSSIAALFTATPPSNWRDDRAANLAREVGEKIRETEASITIPPNPDFANPGTDSLDKIRRVVPEEDNARVSLEALGEKIKELDSKLKGLDATDHGY
ncbi:hypothetical protein C8R44DRAFT_725895 [Mycena epipterygia]|nr:hypothetical protein C8R44DRAFT_725895 [Mycena epipterygia]